MMGSLSSTSPGHDAGAALLKLLSDPDSVRERLEQIKASEAKLAAAVAGHAQMLAEQKAAHDKVLEAERADLVKEIEAAREQLLRRERWVAQKESDLRALAASFQAQPAAA